MSLSVLLKPQQAIDKDHSLLYELFWIGIMSISGENVEWWNQNTPVGALGGSTRPPNATCSLDCATLLNSFVWTDITAKFSLDLSLYPSQKQKWKLRSLGGLNLFQSFLFFQRILFPLREKRKEKRSMTLSMGFLKNILQRKCLFSTK